MIFEATGSCVAAAPISQLLSQTTENICRGVSRALAVDQSHLAFSLLSVD